VVASGVVAVLHTVSATKEDDANVWDALLKSNYVTGKLVGSSKKPPTVIEDCIKAYNGNACRRQKGQILTMVCQRYPYSLLKQYNQPNFEYDEDSDDIDDDELEVVEKQNNKLYWSEPLTKRKHHKARLDFAAFGHCFGEISVPAKIIKKIDDVVLAMVLDLFTGSSVIQPMAYGTITRRNEDGSKSYMSRVVRMVQKADLVRLAQAFVKEQGYNPPSTTFLFRILRLMPAASTRDMRGVSFVKEEFYRAIPKLKEIADKTAAKGADPIMVDELKTCVNTLHSYYRNNLAFELSLDDSCAEHCVGHALSDPNNPLLTRKCVNDHSDECHHCRMGPKIIKAFQGFLEHMKDKFEAGDFYQICKDVKAADLAIKEYKHSTMRSFAQNSEWIRLKDEMDPTTVFVTCDWAMKW
jgi:hypothetical protein